MAIKLINGQPVEVDDPEDIEAMGEVTAAALALDAAKKAYSVAQAARSAAEQKLADAKENEDAALGRFKAAQQKMRELVLTSVGDAAPVSPQNEQVAPLKIEEVDNTPCTYPRDPWCKCPMCKLRTA